MFEGIGNFIDLLEKKYLVNSMATITGNPHFHAEHSCKEIFDAMECASKDETKRVYYSESEIRLVKLLSYLIGEGLFNGKYLFIYFSNLIRIIEELTNHNNDQRQNIRMKYKQLYGFDLKDHIKTQMSGDLLNGLVSLLYTPTEYDVRTIHKSLTQFHQHPLSVIEILTTRNSYELRQIERAYERKFKSNLADDLRSEKSYSLSEVLRGLLASNR